jgi:hypothetical protein
MGMFVDLIYKLILPAAKREGVDPESVANFIKNNRKEISAGEAHIKKMFDDGRMQNKDGKTLKYDDVFPL